MSSDMFAIFRGQGGNGILVRGLEENAEHPIERASPLRLPQPAHPQDKGEDKGESPTPHLS